MRASDDTNDILTNLIHLFLENYEREENILRNGSNYALDCVDLTYVQFHTIQLKRGSSYIPSPKWISDKKATINPKNRNDNLCFSDSIIAALHHEKTGKDPQRISKLRPFISNYNWKDINFPAGKKDWNTFVRNNKYIALNLFSAHATEKKISLIRRSDYNLKRKHVIDLLMITDNQNNWNYLAIKKHEKTNQRSYIK